MAEEKEVKSAEDKTVQVGNEKETPEFTPDDDAIKPAPPEMIRPDHAIKKNAQHGGIDLSDATVETLEKQGVLLDGTHTLKSSPEKQPKKKEGKAEEKKEAEATPEGQPEKSAKPEEKNKEEPKKEPEKEEAKKEEEPGEESETEEEHELVKSIKEMIPTLDEDGQKQLKSDLKNRSKFTKANTERAMKLAEREKKLGDLELLDGFARFASSEEITETSDSIQAIPKADLEDAMLELDERFDEVDADPKKNPIRKLCDLIFKAAPEATKLTESQRKQAEKDIELSDRKEILDLQAMDSTYKDEEKLMEVSKVADENGVKLAVAHRIRIADTLQSSLDKSDKKVKVLEKEVLDLKTKNEEMKKNLPSHLTPKPEKKVEEEVFEPTIIRSKADETKSFDEVERGLRKKFHLA